MTSPSSSPSVHVSLHDGLAAKMVAGGMSCMLISAVLNPFDCIKIRLQTQNQLEQQNMRKYRSMSEGMWRIYCEEGYGRGLMRGVTPSMMREATYSSIRMGLYDKGKALIGGRDMNKSDIGVGTKLLAGLLTGALGSSLATPLDLTKIRFQHHCPDHPNPHANTFAALAHYYRTGGIRGLYTGVMPTTVRAAVLNGSCLASYDHSKHLLIRSGRFNDGLTAHVSASLISGLVTTTTANPFDVIKTRIMSDGEGNGGKKYRGAFDCAFKTFRTEGLAAFFKGWMPNYLRLGPHFLFSLPLAEFIRKQMGADTF